MSTTRCTPVDFGFRFAETSTDGQKLIINIESFCPETLIQGDKLAFCINKCITYPSTALGNVFVNVNGTDFQLIKIGEVKWDQLKSRVKYYIVFGTESPTATVLNNLPCSKYNYPTYTTTSNTFEKVVTS